MTIAEIKAAVRITDLLDHFDMKYNRKGSMCCPFHNDRNPSMQVFFDTDMVRCFSGNCEHQGKGMDIIDFCMHHKHITKHEAIKYCEGIARSMGVTQSEAKPTKRKGPAPYVDKLLAEEGVLERMWSYFRHGITTSPTARTYCKARHLDYVNQCVGYNSGQFHHGNRKDEAFIKQCVEVGLLTPFGSNSRSGGQAYNVFGRGCLVFPLRDKEEKVTGLYFRNTHPKKTPLPGKHYYLKNRKGLFPSYPKAGTKKLILTESVIDAVTLLQQEAVTKEYEVLALYGTNGWSDDHTKAFERLGKLEEVVLFLDGDEAGRGQLAKYRDKVLQLQPEAMVKAVATPEGEDINSLLKGHSPEVLQTLIKEALPAEQVLPLFEQAQPVLRERSNENEQAAQAEPEVEVKSEPKAGKLDVSNPYKIKYVSPIALYVVRGGVKSDPESLKVSLEVSCEATTVKSRQKLDLYDDKQTEKTAKSIGERLGLETEKVFRDLSRLTDLLDEYREKQPNQKNQAPKEKQGFRLTQEQQKQAVELGKSQNLLKKINELVGQSGIVGEEKSRLFLFCVASSHRMANPLHVVVQGSSGSGKSHLIGKVADLIPQEWVRRYTRISDKALYNFGEWELKNNLIIIEDYDGLSEEVEYALRELMSSHRLSYLVSDHGERGKADNKNGGGKAELYVRGPIATMAATTQGQLYHDNETRVFVIGVDESSEQTLRIIKAANLRASGEHNQQAEEAAVTTLQNYLRSLKPLEVVNPYLKHIKLPVSSSQQRRLHAQFSGLCNQITLLHQHQRKRDKQGRLIAQKEDVAAAVELMFESIILKVDELDGSLRVFFEDLKQYLKEKSEGPNVRFSQREVRQHFKLSRSHCHRFFSELQELEYIKQVSGHANRGYQYEVLYWDDNEKLRTEIKTDLENQVKRL